MNNLQEDTRSTFTLPPAWAARESFPYGEEAAFRPNSGFSPNPAVPAEGGSTNAR